MKIKLDQGVKNGIILITYIFILYKIGVVTENIKGVTHFFRPFIYGFVIAYLMNMLIGGIETALKKIPKKNINLSKRGYNALIFVNYIFILGIVIGSFFLIIPSIVSGVDGLKNILINIDIEGLSSDLSGYVYKFTGESYELEDLVIFITSKTADWLNNIKNYFPQIIGATTQVMNFFVNLFLGIIISIYMLLNKSSYISGSKKVMLAYLGKQRSEYIWTLIHKIHKAFTDFIGTVLLGALIVSSITFIGTSLMGIKYSPLIAITIAIGNLIPFFGPIFGLIIAVIIVAISSPSKVIIYIIFAIILQQFDANILNPRIVGDKLGLDALLVIFAVIFMSGVFGFTGTLIGVPIFAVVFILIKESVEKRLERIQ